MAGGGGAGRAGGDAGDFEQDAGERLACLRRVGIWNRPLLRRAAESLPPPQRFGLAFGLLQWRWQLTGITLPENIQNLLADELIKAMKERERKP